MTEEVKKPETETEDKTDTTPSEPVQTPAVPEPVATGIQTASMRERNDVNAVEESRLKQIEDEHYPDFNVNFKGEFLVENKDFLPVKMLDIPSAYPKVLTQEDISKGHRLMTNKERAMAYKSDSVNYFYNELDQHGRIKNEKPQAMGGNDAKIINQALEIAKLKSLEVQDYSIIESAYDCFLRDLDVKKASFVREKTRKIATGQVDNSGNNTQLGTMLWNFVHKKDGAKEYFNNLRGV